MTSSEYDYIIVGAGSAGCTLASRLTEDADTRVLLLEAGGWDRDFWLKIPLGWGKVYKERLYDWHYDTEPEPYAGNRKMEVARGKVIGGSSSTNAMAYVRGHRGDYDRWAAMGAGLVVRGRAALFQEAGKLGGRRDRISRRRRPADHAPLALRRPAGRCLYRGGGQAGYPLNRRL